MSECLLRLLFMYTFRSVPCRESFYWYPKPENRTIQNHCRYNGHFYRGRAVGTFT